MAVSGKDVVPPSLDHSTQGRGYKFGAGGLFVSVSLYVDKNWQEKKRRVDLWMETKAYETERESGWAVIGITTVESVRDPLNSIWNYYPRFRVWDYSDKPNASVNFDHWADLDIPIQWGRWYDLRIELALPTAQIQYSRILYYLDCQLVYVDNTTYSELSNHTMNATFAKSAILTVYDFGSDYSDVFFDNFTYGEDKDMSDCHPSPENNQSDQTTGGAILSDISWVFIAIIIVLVVVILILLIIFFVWRRRRRQRKLINNTTVVYGATDQTNKTTSAKPTPTNPNINADDDEEKGSDDDDDIANSDYKSATHQSESRKSTSRREKSASSKEKSSKQDGDDTKKVQTKTEDTKPETPQPVTPPKQDDKKNALADDDASYSYSQSVSVSSNDTANDRDVKPPTAPTSSVSPIPTTSDTNTAQVEKKKSTTSSASVSASATDSGDVEDSISENNVAVSENDDH